MNQAFAIIWDIFAVVGIFAVASTISFLFLLWAWSGIDSKGSEDGVNG